MLIQIRDIILNKIIVWCINNCCCGDSVYYSLASKSYKEEWINYQKNCK